MSETDDRIAGAILTLTGERGPHGSICPSEAARAVGGEHWRDLMDRTRAVARTLAAAGRVTVTSRGEVLSPAVTWRGPVRIRVAGTADHASDG